MNTPNNKRKKESMERIEKVFIELLQTKALNEISVSDICKRAGLNRTTFYANYTDIYGLADAIRDKLEIAVSDLYKDEITQGFNSHDYLKLFRHIKENQILIDQLHVLLLIRFISDEEINHTDCDSCSCRKG